MKDSLDFVPKVSKMPSLIEIITSERPEVRDLSLDSQCAGLGADALLDHCHELDAFRRSCENLYQRVRSLFFLYAIHRFHLPNQLAGRESGRIPFSAYEHLLGRRFSEAIDEFLAQQRHDGPSITLSSALASAYHRLAFQTLADQVRRSVRSVRGNQWMFRTGNPQDLPIRVRSEMLQRNAIGAFPILRERTAVRMDFSHSGWSDIFFLGMDFPAGARVINASINLAVQGRHDHPQPPIDCSVRVIDQPILRLVSIDLDAVSEIRQLSDVFDFGADYLGLLKAAVIAAGLVPAGLEGHHAGIDSVLRRLLGPGLGLEIVSRVNDIPKGSRLAVSTNLLGGLIAMLMRVTGQVSTLTGGLNEADRRIVAARAILGEWIGGSGGGWQDSGGVWPGIKLISGAAVETGDPEFGISRGRLLPQHHVFSHEEISAETRRRLQESLVLVHGGMAQNVGPILEMVTEKYLLRSEHEWKAREQAMELLEEITTHLKSGDIRAIGAATSKNFAEPLQQIIPWCSNRYTETLIENCRQKYGEDFWGFWMLGGMAGGGMGFIFSPEKKTEARQWLLTMMTQTKRELEQSLPFAMDPVVYDFEINDQGTTAQWADADDLPSGYYPLMVPAWLRQDIQALSPLTQQELERVGGMCQDAKSPLAAALLRRILPGTAATETSQQRLPESLQACGFDAVAHQQIREDLLSGRLGLSQNRLPATAKIEDVEPSDVVDARHAIDPASVKLGQAAIAAGQVAVLTLAAGVGSRWTQGAGVVKALHPFCRMAGQHRTFLEVHLAKSRLLGNRCGHFPTHLFSTGYLTQQPIQQAIATMLAADADVGASGYPGRVVVSPGRSVGLRMIPTLRDLEFAWNEMPQQVLDQQQEKMRQSGRSALMQWAEKTGQASDYTDNLPAQCMHPVGHWYEVPNLFRNGELGKLLRVQPQLKYLLLHNVDTLGATLDPGMLGLHMQSQACLSFEVISRRLEDRGGGLARVDGRVRLVEGLAMPNEEDEFGLTFYNSMTTWIDIDRLLQVFQLSRKILMENNESNQAVIDAAVRRLARRMPTYVTLKEVKKRWGNGQEDVFPVAQFEKLWGDMTALPEVECQFMVVPTRRGQQLKEQSQLDAWLRDGSAAEIEAQTSF